MDKLTLGQKIRFYRLKNGVSQLELEAMIQASPGSISRIENDKINPTKETLHHIAVALNLNEIERAKLFNIEIAFVENNYIDLIVEKVLSRIKSQDS